MVASRKEYSNQKGDVFYWSTIWHDNLSNLYINTKASSTLDEYSVSNLFDKSLDTAWVEGSNGPGVGEIITISLNTRIGKYNTEHTSADYFILDDTLYLKSNKTWSENNRVKSALLIIKRNIFSIKGSYDSYVILRLKFKDIKQLQVFDIQKYDDILM